jgi:hypothetical protein
VQLHYEVCERPEATTTSRRRGAQEYDSGRLLAFLRKEIRLRGGLAIICLRIAKVAIRTSFYGTGMSLVEVHRPCDDYATLIK